MARRSPSVSPFSPASGVADRVGCGWGVPETVLESGVDDGGNLPAHMEAHREHWLFRARWLHLHGRSNQHARIITHLRRQTKLERAAMWAANRHPSQVHPKEARALKELREA